MQMASRERQRAILEVLWARSAPIGTEGEAELNEIDCIAYLVVASRPLARDLPKVVGKCRTAIPRRILGDETTVQARWRRLGGNSALQNEVVVRGRVVLVEVETGTYLAGGVGTYDPTVQGSCSPHESEFGESEAIAISIWVNAGCRLAG